MIFKNISIFAIFMGVLAVNANAQTSPDPQPKSCEATSFGFKEDLLQSTYHNTIAKTETALPGGAKTSGFAVWGQASAPDGVTAQLTPREITPANGFTYNGQPLHATSGGRGSVDFTQSILLSTQGLYAWGKPGSVLPISVTSANGAKFGKVNITNTNTFGLPTGVNPESVVKLRASNDTLAILTNTGSVYVMNPNNSEIYGVQEFLGGAAGKNSSWNQVRTAKNSSSGSAASLTGITDLRITNTAAFALNKETQKLYTWGSRTYDGNGNNAKTQLLPVEMTALPTFFPASKAPKIVQIALIDSSFDNKTSDTVAKVNYRTHYLVLADDGYIYSLGDNYAGVGGIGESGAINTWKRVINPNGANTFPPSLSNVVFISGQDQTNGLGTASAILENGEVYSWGNNGNQNNNLYPNDVLGLTGETNSVPKRPKGVPVGAKVSYIENGGHITPLVIETESVDANSAATGQYCNVGHNENGGFGDGTTENRSSYLCRPTELTAKLVIFNEVQCPAEINLTKETSGIDILGPGKYKVTYLIGAENTGEKVGTYDVVDVLNFGSNITVVNTNQDKPSLVYDVTNEDKSETLSPENSANPMLETGNIIPVVRGETIAGGAKEFWKLTVVFQHDVANGSPDDLECTEDSDTGFASGGLANNVELTTDETTTTDNGTCPSVPLPPEINLTKETSSVEVVGQGKYKVTYVIGAENKSEIDGKYDVVDVLSLGSNLSVVNTSADKPSLVYDATNVDKSETLTPENSANPMLENGNIIPVVRGETLAAGKKEFWLLTVVFQHDMENGSPADLICTEDSTTGMASGGLGNNVNVTFGEVDQTDNGTCPQVPQIELIKSVSNAINNNDGTHTISYKIVAINKGGADGTYDIIDALDTQSAGNSDGVTAEIISLVYDDESSTDSQTGVISVAQASVKDEGLIGSVKNDNSGETQFFQDVFLLTVKFTLAETAPDGGQVNLDCTIDETTGFASGAFANNVTGSNTEFDTTNNGACPLLPEIALVKTSSVDLGEDGTLNPGDLINYRYTVTNIGSVDLFDISVTEVADKFTGDFTQFITLPTYLNGGSEIVGAPDNDNPNIKDIALNAIGDEARIIFIASYSITAQDIERGSVINQAVTKGKDNNGNEVTDDSDDDNPFEDEPTITLLPKIEFAKTIKADGNDYPVYNATANEYTVVYEITATNSGKAAGFYNVVDQFSLGEGIELIEANIAYNSDAKSDAEERTGTIIADGEFTDASAETTLVTEEGLMAGLFETWTLTARFKITDMEQVAIESNNSCQGEGSLEATGAFTNIVIPAITESDETNNDACVEFPRRTITDYVWIDWNKNGTRESEEAYVSNVRVRLDAIDSDGNVISSIDPLFASTDSSGKYVFIDLIPGNYQVTLVGHIGELQTDLTVYDSDLDGIDSEGKMNGTGCLVDADDTGFITQANVLSENFSGEGNPLFCPGNLGDTVWWDRNNNTIQETQTSVPVEDREPLLEGVTVTLTGADSIFGNDITEQTTTTDNRGLYSFEDLIPGLYKVSVDPDSLKSAMDSLSNGNNSDIRPTYDYDDINATDTVNNASYELDYDPVQPFVQLKEKMTSSMTNSFLGLDFGYNRDMVTSVEFNNYSFTVNNEEIYFQFSTPSTDNSLAFVIYGRTDNIGEFKKLTRLERNNDEGFGSSISFNLPSSINNNLITEVMVVSLDDMGFVKKYVPIKVSQ